MKRITVLLTSFALLAALTSFTYSTYFSGGGDDIIGLWEPSNGKARVKIEKIGNKYYGKIVWLRAPIDPVTKNQK